MSLNPEYSPEPRRAEPQPQPIEPEPHRPEPSHLETEKRGPQPDPPVTEPGPATPPAKQSLGTRTGWAWTGLTAGAIILIVLLVFILQNLGSVTVSLFFWEFNLPVGIAVLLSAIGGALLMACVGGLRILQLRRAAKH
ncbi:lipopolysaccharide assembly protein LapA domain-containing protein [Nocardia sp. NPDC048505]|uniref:LapA family protein n=1 Tax=unclassified Nocardia TaxID=2637762 RepID=UPI0034015BDE